MAFGILPFHMTRVSICLLQSICAFHPTKHLALKGDSQLSPFVFFFFFFALDILSRMNDDDTVRNPLYRIQNGFFSPSIFLVCPVLRRLSTLYCITISTAKKKKEQRKMIEKDLHVRWIVKKLPKTTPRVFRRSKADHEKWLLTSS